MPADYSRITRILHILTLVQSGGRWNAERLAEATGTTQRSIYRDLKVLGSLGIPLVYDKEKQSYVIAGGFFLPPVQLKPEEALALVALAEQVGGQEQVPHLRAAIDAARKLRAQLPAAVRTQLEKTDGKVNIRLAAASPPESGNDVFSKVHQAIELGQRLEVTYDSLRAMRAGEVASKTFHIDPYALLFNQRAWYLVAFSHKHGEVRNFKLSRFTRLRATKELFTRPKDWTLEKHLGNAWRMIRGKPRYDVELHFDSEFADTIDETRWHPTQQTEPLDGGGLKFTAQVDGLDELVWWVLSMGPHCRVVRPAELADRVRDLAEKTARLYGCDAPCLSG